MTTKPTHTAYISLGSNLGDAQNYITSAMRHLAEHDDITVSACSNLYGSHAVGPGSQPDYINAAAKLSTTLGPEPLLKALQTIEHAHERTRNVRWEARTLDLDLLYYDNVEIHSHTLTLPHPRINERNFVIIPLHDIAPELVLSNGKTVNAHMANMSTDGIWEYTPS